MRQRKEVGEKVEFVRYLIKSKKERKKPIEKGKTKAAETIRTQFKFLGWRKGRRSI